MYMIILYNKEKRVQLAKEKCQDFLWIYFTDKIHCLFFNQRFFGTVHNTYFDETPDFFHTNIRMKAYPNTYISNPLSSLWIP